MSEEADDSLDLLIRIKSDTAGAKTAEGALKDVGGAQEDAGKKAEVHTGHLREMHKLFHALNEVVPGLGVLMQAAFTPVGAAISGAVIVFRLFREHIKQVNEELDKLGEENAKPATNRLNALREATVSAAAAMNELRLKLADAARVDKSGAQTMQEATEAMKERAKVAETLAEATNANELARLEAMHAAGLISESKYAEDRLAIELAFQDKKRQLGENAAMLEILVRRRALEQAEMAQPGLEDKAAGAVLMKTKALEDLNALPDAAGVEQRMRASEKALKDFETKYAPHLNVLQGDGPFESKYAQDLHDQWVNLSGAASGAQKEWQGLPGERARRQVAADNASAEYDRASRAAIENQKFRSETGDDLGRRQLMFGQSHRDNQQIGSVQQDTGMQQALAKARESVEKDRQLVIQAMEHSSGLSALVIQKMQEHNKLLQDLEKRVREMKGRPERVY